MWATILWTHNLFSTLSALQLTFFLSMLLAAGSWLLVAVNMKLRRSKKNSESIETISLPTKSSPSEHFQPPPVSKAAALFAFIVVCCLAYVKVAMADKPVVSFERVLVVRQVSHNSWWMVKSDGPFIYNGCPDFDNEKFIWAGYRMKTLTYQEMGLCKSIRDTSLGVGVWWIRDPETGAVPPASPEELREAERQIAEYTGRTQGGNEYARR